MISFKLDGEVQVELGGERSHGTQRAGGQDNRPHFVFKIMEDHGGVEAPEVGRVRPIQSGRMSPSVCFALALHSFLSS